MASAHHYLQLTNSCLHQMQKYDGLSAPFMDTHRKFYHCFSYIVYHNSAPAYMEVRVFHKVMQFLELSFLLLCIPLHSMRFDTMNICVECHPNIVISNDASMQLVECDYNPETIFQSGTTSRSRDCNP